MHISVYIKGNKSGPLERYYLHGEKSEVAVVKGM